MKRSVAIKGDTPAFLRWAIWHACDLRPLEPVRFADQTFRALRGVRELSVAKVERRCTKEYCFHPESIESSGAVGSGIRGFQRAEIAAAFGGEALIESSCQGCPANALSQQMPGVAAGCFGFLSTTEFDLQQLLSGYPQNTESEFELVGEIQSAAVRLDLEAELRSLFGQGGIVWHRLWKDKILAGRKLELIVRLFDSVIEESSDAVPRHVLAFKAALQACVSNRFTLHTELVPSGFSDGETWSLKATCPDCGYEPAAIKKLQKCIGCGRIGGTSNGPKFRVLGIRPYSHLAGIIGEERAKAEVELLLNDQRRDAGEVS